MRRVVSDRTLVKVGCLITHVELDWSNPIWRPWFSLLMRRHTLIRYDWRGWGLSDRHVGHISFERLVDDLDAVIAGPLRFTLFGIAGGCAVAIAYAVRWPDRVERLVLYGGYTRGAIARSESREDDEEARTVLSVVELGGGKEDPSFRQLFIAQFIPDATPAQAREFNELMRLSGGSKDAARVLSILYKVDIRPNAARVRCPTLVLHPVHNFRIPFEEGRALTACIPNARLVPLNSRNFLLLEQEEAWIQFVSEIEGFLAAPNATLAADQYLELQDLTLREREVLELLAQGFDNHRIAEKLVISEKTVRNHVSMILAKLGVQSRLQAAVRAREAGYGRRRT
jgi:pimeloyl-ACP methyl ester carboxylesterase/DNA-binding CsgD family transcriptional regulator